MSQLTKPLLAELEQESAATRRVLEAVPGDRLDWKPTDVSMTLGQLALHVATTPRFFATFLQKDSMDRSDVKFSGPPQPASVGDLTAALDETIGEVTAILSSWNDEFASATWRFTNEGKDMIAAPRVAVFRTLGMNHMVHHRGQLSTYLRLLGGPVPSVYGPTADDNPFD
jgi:uncharacterized damage-inducible protein DinB